MSSCTGLGPRPWGPGSSASCRRPRSEELRFTEGGAGAGPGAGAGAGRGPSEGDRRRRAALSLRRHSCSSRGCCRLAQASAGGAPPPVRLRDGGDEEEEEEEEAEEEEAEERERGPLPPREWSARSGARLGGWELELEEGADPRLPRPDLGLASSLRPLSSRGPGPGGRGRGLAGAGRGPTPGGAPEPRWPAASRSWLGAL
ncbi:hypothetical protein chiPu_0026267 [Chiloscyllium punctatum]|uniref:Uncharacterized protein n=1 Tax=Chiloscyllium punctatum TaxID=137246 RepID=A0A401THW3_CHIPU|nr:hypothetical protein [Chiloscyllium punctatum]